MKKRVFIISFIILMLSANTSFAKFPIHLGGFILGDDMANYSHLIDMKTCKKVAFNEYLGEGEIFAPPGFKTGLIAYGQCDQPNKIVRIKLKYEDSSKKFFKKLLRQYKKQLGDPTEYKGDPFQTLIAWKWSFTNAKNEKISLILQHNIMVEDEKKGTAVKLTLTSQIEKERACFMAKVLNKKKALPPYKPSFKKKKNPFIPY